jgi:hypothetical protein
LKDQTWIQINETEIYNFSYVTRVDQINSPGRFGVIIHFTDDSKVFYYTTAELRNKVFDKLRLYVDPLMLIFEDNELKN